MTSSDTYSGEDVLPIGAVARRLGVSVDTVREWEKDKKIPASFRTPGNQRRWFANDIEALRGVA